MLNDRKKCVRDSKILLLGMAYKRDVGDIRESPALTILASLEAKGARVAYHDPYIESIEQMGKEWRSQPLDSPTLQEQDCVVIVTNHSCFDYQAIVRDSQLVFDTRNATQGARNDCAHVEVL